VTAGARIVVVDDSRHVREAAYAVLSSLGHEVTCFEDGFAALEAAVAAPPDLIVLDVVMPELDGFAVLRELRNREATARVPVVMLTGEAGEESQIEGWSEGADEYVTKPFSPKALSEVVSSLLARGTGEARRDKAVAKLKLMKGLKDLRTDEGTR